MDVCIVGCYIFLANQSGSPQATITPQQQSQNPSLSYPTQASMTQLGSISEPLRLFRWEGSTSVTRVPCN